MKAKFEIGDIIKDGDEILGTVYGFDKEMGTIIIESPIKRDKYDRGLIHYYLDEDKDGNQSIMRGIGNIIRP